MKNRPSVQSVEILDTVTDIQQTMSAKLKQKNEKSDKITPGFTIKKKTNSISMLKDYPKIEDLQRADDENKEKKKESKKMNQTSSYLSGFSTDKRPRTNKKNDATLMRNVFSKTSSDVGLSNFLDLKGNSPGIMLPKESSNNMKPTNSLFP